MTYENKDRFWYAVGIDHNLYCLGDCGDIHAAKEVAEDTLDLDVVCLLNEHHAKQWREVLEQ